MASHHFFFPSTSKPAALQRPPMSSFLSLHPNVALKPHLFSSSQNVGKTVPRSLRISCSNSDQQQQLENAPLESEENDATANLFEKLKETERGRIRKLEKLEEQSSVQLERQLVMASTWSRKLLTLQGKLKGTELDPENSHTIDYSEFWSLLNSNKVQFMEYSDYGRRVSVILPYYRDGKGVSHGNGSKDVVFRRHVVDRMPADCWNDVWQKLHQQLIHVDVYHPPAVPIEINSTISAFVIWTVRFALSVALYFWIDNMMRPIYSKLVRSDIDKAPQRRRKFKEKQELGLSGLGSMGKSRATFISAEETTGVTFDDFAGQDYIKKELQEIVRILKNDEEYQNRGIYCPKGVLLHGPPGTGKTLLAKAIAGEAGLPFFAVNGTDFVEMFVGVAAARVRDLFSTARSYAPSIIFIDEIDAIGSKRGGEDIGGGGAEREHGLLQILTEMDGFRELTAQILVIGATNRLDILDPALLRKGRFDRIVRVGLPSKDGRLAILKVHARNKFFRSENEKESFLREIALLADGFSGAELQNILNEAGILAARKDLDFIGRDELLEAFQRQKGTFETGQEDKVVIPEEIRLRLAYREAAVSVLACYYPKTRPFVQTNIRTIGIKSNLQYAKKTGRAFLRKVDYVNSIVKACAPRIIEEEIFGVDNMCWISARATRSAANSADHLILQTGMTALGKACYNSRHDVVPNVAPKLQVLRDAYMRFAVDKCRSILKEYSSAVETITDILLEKEEIEADKIWEIFRNSPRITQSPVYPVDEYGELLYAGRWGIHGISLPGRVTFAPGNVGFSNFGAPRPLETQIISDETWKAIDASCKERVQEIKDDILRAEENEERPQLVMTDHIF